MNAYEEYIDMAVEILDEVATPTLFIVGGEDEQVLERNEYPYEQLDCEKDLHVVAGADHLFEEPGELEEVADYAGQWFTSHLA